MLYEGLQVFLENDKGAWDMQSDGSYLRQTGEGKDARCAQDLLLELMAGQAF